MKEFNEFNQILAPEVKNWCPAKLPSQEILHGNFCYLAPLTTDNYSQGLFESLSIDNRGESWTYLPYGPFQDHVNFQLWIKNTLAEKDRLYAIIDANTQTPVGISGFLRINPEHGSIEVGHLHYSVLLKRKPAATEAMYLMMYQVFEKWGYRRYEWKCNTLNQASQDAALRLGFKFEGIFRQSHVLKNRNRDTAWFSIIDSEWPEIKARFEAWLQPNNFDEQGNQIKKLSHII